MVGFVRSGLCKSSVVVGSLRSVRAGFTCLVNSGREITRRASFAARVAECLNVGPAGGDDRAICMAEFNSICCCLPVRARDVTVDGYSIGMRPGLRNNWLCLGRCALLSSGGIGGHVQRSTTLGETKGPRPGYWLSGPVPFAIAMRRPPDDAGPCGLEAGGRPSSHR